MHVVAFNPTKYYLRAKLLERFCRLTDQGRVDAEGQHVILIYGSLTDRVIFQQPL